MKKLLSLLSVLTIIGSAVPTTIAASPYQKEEKEENKTINNNFYETNLNILPSGNAEFIQKNEQLNIKHSNKTSTGLFVKANKEIKIIIEKLNKNDIVYAHIGQIGEYKDINNGKSLEFKKYKLQDKITEFKSDIDGVLYISNENYENTIEVKINVKDAIIIPTFKLGINKIEDFKQEINKNNNSPFVEIIGNNVFATIQMSFAKELWITNKYKNIQNLEDVVKYWDLFFEKTIKIYGLSITNKGVAKKYNNKIHIGNSDKKSWSAWGYASDPINIPGDNILDLFKDAPGNNWGLWHEIGHTFQNPNYKLDDYDLLDVTCNISALYIQESLFPDEKLRINNNEVIFNSKKHVNSGNSFNNLGYFEKLLMFWQLHKAFGVYFYPTLNQKYRVLSDEELPKNNNQKNQLFIEIASQTSGYDLSTFFIKWGIKVEENTLNNINKLNLKKLDKDIWNNFLNGTIKVLTPVSKYEVTNTNIEFKKDVEIFAGNQFSKELILSYIVNPSSLEIKKIQ